MKSVRLSPFIGVNDILFSFSMDDMAQRLGAPRRRGRNAVALDELDHGNLVLRFQDNDRLEEITTEAPVLTLGSVSIPFAALKAFIQAQDSETFERAGFTVSPRFGLAFVPNEPLWITALARHCLPEWTALPS